MVQPYIPKEDINTNSRKEDQPAGINNDININDDIILIDENELSNQPLSDTSDNTFQNNNSQRNDITSDNNDNYNDNDDDNDDYEYEYIIEPPLIIRFLIFIISVVIGAGLAIATLLYGIEHIPYVTSTVTVKDMDWGADLPYNCLCYITKDIPALSDSYEFGQYVAYIDNNGNKVIGSVISIDDNGLLGITDSQENIVEIPSDDCIGVVTFTIPVIGGLK